MLQSWLFAASGFSIDCLLLLFLPTLLAKDGFSGFVTEVVAVGGLGNLQREGRKPLGSTAEKLGDVLLKP